MTDKQTESPVVQASPIVKEVKTMMFSITMDEIIAGKKITKQEWGNDKIYGYLSPPANHLTLHKEDGKDYYLIVSDGDLNGIDWLVLEVKE